MADGLPPWLNVTPSDFVRAREAGASTGLQIASLNQRAAIEAEQLGQAAQAEQDRVMLAEQEMRAKRELAQQELNRRLQQENMLNAYRTAQLGLGQSRIDQAKRVAEEKRNAAALGMANIYKFADVLKTTGDPMLAWQLAPGVPATSASAMARAHKETQPVTVTEGTTTTGVPFVAGGGRWQLVKDARFEADMTVLKQEHASELARQRNMTDEEDLKKSRERAADIARQMRELASSRGQRPAAEPEPAAGAPGRPAGVVYPWERSAMPSPSLTVTPADIAPMTTSTATEPAPAPAPSEPDWKKVKIRTQADADFQIANARKAIERAPSKREEILSRLREALREGGFSLKEGE